MIVVVHGPWVGRSPWPFLVHGPSCSKSVAAGAAKDNARRTAKPPSPKHDATAKSKALRLCRYTPSLLLSQFVQEEPDEKHGTDSLADGGGPDSDGGLRSAQAWKSDN